MNILTDIPLHIIYHKISNKKKAAGYKCELHQFNISDIIEMIGDGNCQYTGKPFKNLEDITFERVNPYLGYVKGNVLTVSRAANGSKSGLDAFSKGNLIPTPMKIKLLRKALYILEKGER